MVLLATNYIPVVVNHLLMAFYSARVPFTCQVSDNWFDKPVLYTEQILYTFTML